MTHANAVREPGQADRPGLKLSDLKPGDTIEIDEENACLIKGPAEILADSEGELFFHCRQGMHYLDGMQGDGEILVGVRRAETAQ